MQPTVFLDTETTSLRYDRRAWEIGLIYRSGSATDPDREVRYVIDVEDLDLGNADPASLSIGRFYDRHPQMVDAVIGVDVSDEIDALREVDAITRGAVIVGAVPNFDTETLAPRMRAHGLCPSWHYHLVDVEALAAGWLHRYALTLENQAGQKIAADALRTVATPRWYSDALSEALGIRLTEGERHTALGDAKWARAIYDAIIRR